MPCSSEITSQNCGNRREGGRETVNSGEEKGGQAASHTLAAVWLQSGPAAAHLGSNLVATLAGLQVNNLTHFGRV